MNILVISSILPIPGALQENDFIYRLYGHYKALYPGDHVEIIMPVKYDLNIRTVLRGQSRVQKLQGKFEWKIKDFQVHIYPYFAAWSWRNLHALVSHSAFRVNRKRIGLMLQHTSFDLIHARFILPDGLLASQIARLANIPYIVATHKELFYFDHFYSRKVAFRLLRKAAKVLPVSNMNLQFFQSNGMQHVAQLSHGFSPSFIKDQRLALKGPVKLLSVCRLLGWKNIDKVIRALGLLKDRVEFRYTIIGSGPEESAWKQLAADEGIADRIEFIDHVPHEEIGERMYAHDIFVLPSYFETFGRVYFECMAMGIPVICARNSGIYGLFNEGIEAFSVDHNNVNALSDLLEKLIKEPELRLEVGRKGQKLVRNYTWENIARELHGHYEECIRT